MIKIFALARLKFLAFSGILLLCPLLAAHGITVTYHIDTSSSGFSFLGAGQMTLKDTPDAVVGNVQEFDFSGVVGMGQDPWGAWTGARLSYDSLTEMATWSLNLSGAISTAFFPPVVVTPNVPVFQQFEELTAALGIAATREPMEAPETIPAVLLLAGSAAGLILLRKAIGPGR
jgi:hypothetical protein